MPNRQFEQLLATARSGNPEAQFLLSQFCLQQDDFDGMLSWLQMACDAGLPDALGAFGQCYEKGQGVAVDMLAAMNYYSRAVDAGSKIAAYSKAQLLFKSKQGLDNSEQIRKLLHLAANANVVPALRTIGYLAMQSASERDFAIVCLRRSALQGDVASAFMLGWCLLQDQEQLRSTQESAYWLQLALQADFPLAGEMLSSLEGTSEFTAPAPISNGVIDCNTRFAMYPDPKHVQQERLSADPEIVLYSDVLDIVDRAYLIYLSRPYLKRASVIDPDGDASGMVSKVRTSMSTYIPFEVVEIISRYIELKIVRTTNENLLVSEPMSILCYAPGEYYRPHFDFFNPNLNVSAEFLQDGGQRITSAVTYLTAPMAGGGTSFPKLRVTVPAVAGSTLWFRNCQNGGQVDKRSLHAGDEVIEGEKWVVTKWFRERRTQYLPI